MKDISQEHKEAIKVLLGQKEFLAFLDFLKIQKHNLAVLEWVRTDSLDPLLAVKKAKWEGMVKMIDELFTLVEKIKKENKDEE